MTGRGCGSQGESLVRWSRNLRSILIFALLPAVAVALFGFSYLAPHQIPPVPDPDTSDMEPQVATKIQAYRQAVVVDSESHQAWGRLGMVLQAHGLKRDAAECYRQAIVREPGEFRWHYLLAHALKDDDPEAALVEAELATQARPDYSATYVLRGELLEEAHRLDPALEQYQKAVALDPQCAMAEFGLGRVYLSKRELEASLRHLLRAKGLSEDAAEVRALLAQAYRRLGDVEAAVREARLASELTGKVPITDPVHFEMRQESVSSLTLLERARAAEEAGEYETAEAIYRELLEIRPDDADLHAGLGDTLARQDKRQPAKEQYLAALAIHPKHASALYGLGNMLSFERNYQEAARRYEESLEVRPDHIPSLVNLGGILAFRGRLDEAAALYRKGLEIDPDHFACHRQLGQLLLQKRQFREAIIHLRAALDARPELGPLHAQMAMALAAEADYEGAWTHVKEAERLGASLPPEFLEELRRRSPEPRGQQP